MRIIEFVWDRVAEVVGWVLGTFGLVLDFLFGWL